MSLLMNIGDIKQEFDELEVKEEFLEGLNESNTSTQKKEESSLSDSLMKTKKESSVKVENEKDSSQMYPIHADLDIKRDCEEIYVKEEDFEDPIDDISKTTQVNETHHISARSNDKSLVRYNAGVSRKIKPKYPKSKSKGNKLKSEKLQENIPPEESNESYDVACLKARMKMAEQLDDNYKELNKTQNMTTSNGQNRKSLKKNDNLVDHESTAQNDTSNPTSSDYYNTKLSEDLQCNTRSTQVTELKSSKSDNTENFMKCSPCKKVFISLHSFKKHRRFHSSERRFECPVCNKKYTQSGNLKIHLKFHTGEKPYHCPQCPIKFTMPGDLKKHLRIHSGERPYGCPECDKKFSESSYLKKHLKVHSGEKPHACPECNETYRTLYTLKTHLSIHSGERSFDCSHCDKKFTKLCQIKRHLKFNCVDKPFDCSECDKKYPSKSQLKYHFRSHTGERPYDCSHCDEKFKYSSSLKGHLRVHTSRPYTLPGDITDQISP